MFYRVLLLFLMLQLKGTFSFSQQLSFTSYTSNNGLSQNSGYCIAQDGLGYIWMGTQDGLNKFNGRKISTYYKETVTRGVLINNFIKSLYFDSTNNWMWIGTVNGLCIYNIYADSFYKASHYFPQADSLDKLTIDNITGVGKNKIAVSTSSDGLFVCNALDKKTQQYLQQPATKDGVMAIANWNDKLLAVANGQLYAIDRSTVLLLPDLQMGDVRNMLVWKNDLWIASANKGLYRISNGNQPNAKLFNCSSSQIGTLATDNENNLWIGSRNKGIIIIEPVNENVLYAYEAANNQDEWPKNFTLSLFKDRQHIMWIGSSGGGFSAAGSLRKNFNIIRKQEMMSGKMAHNMILSMLAPLNNILYLGTQLEGLRTFNTQTGEQLFYPIAGPSGSNTVQGLTNSSDKDIWLATYAGLYNFNTQTKKSTSYSDSSYPETTAGQSVYKLMQRDSLFYSSAKGGVVFFDLKNKKFKPFTYLESNKDTKNMVVYKTYEDADENLWFGCLGLGLQKFSSKVKSLHSITVVSDFSKNIYSICATDSIFWLGSSSGIAVYNSSSNQLIKKITQADGLPGNVVYSIEKDNAGNYWCSTNAGLVKIDAHNYYMVRVPVSEGLQAGEFNTACSSVDAAGNLYFGGINGVSYFKPAAFSIAQYAPAPLIESIKIFNTALQLQQHIASTNSIRLSHLQQYITFEFTVLNFINNNECDYRYRMLGLDTNWVNAGNRNYVSYTNLQPGKYSFQLMASNSSDVWSKKITTIHIIIEAAWWQTSWFNILVALSLAGIAMVLVKNRIAGIRRQAVTKQKITETEMAALKAQMNPHFMFNCINSIDAFIHSNDKYNATLYLNKFAKLLRNILDSSKQNTVLLSKDVDTLKLYIELEELRHENKFTSLINIDSELLNSDYKVPPLIIQPYVENAILHGLKNKPGNDGLLDIRIQKENNFIQYIIQDNGIGREAARLIRQSKESSYGMDMSVERIKLFNQQTMASIEIIDLYDHNKPTGTKIIAHLKIY